MFYIDVERDLAIAQIPKAGILTFREWLKGFKVVSNEQALVVSTRVAFIRHPLERLQSAFSMYHARPDSPAPAGDWQGFVDHVLSQEPNEHWLAQSIHTDGVPNVYHKFEDIADHAKEYVQADLPHNNASVRVPVDSSYRVEELSAMYADDLALWARAA